MLCLTADWHFPLASSYLLILELVRSAQFTNRCEHITVKFQQRDLETASDWDTLTPGCTAEYAWDEPMAAHRLRVVLESATEAFRDAPVQEYNLDDIKASLLTFFLTLSQAHRCLSSSDNTVSRVECLPFMNKKYPAKA